MSLVGSLEELGLGEILQIVSLSRNSGILTLQSKGREGTIVFRFGQVIRATSSNFRRFLGDVLVERGVLDGPTLRNALAIQKEEGYRAPIGSILIREFQVSAERIEEVVREQIEQVVYSLFAWQEGNFAFDLQESVEAVDGIRMDPVQFMLEQGLDTKFLAMEAARILDEQSVTGDRGTGEGGDGQPKHAVDIAFDPMQESTEVSVAESTIRPAAASGTIVLVDDDEGTREFLTTMFRELSFEVSAYAGSEDTLIAVDTLYRQGARPLVMVDLIMPCMDGSGILGGLELLELIHHHFPDLRVMVMSDYHNSDAERQVLGMGIDFILKPRRSDLDDPSAREEFGGRFRELLARAKPGATGTGQVNLGDELRMEMGEIFSPVSAMPVRSTGITLLRGMLEELNDPALGGGIILLVLRFASEFMNRAVIFRPKGGEIVGLGQFGIDDDATIADRKIRNLRIPKEEASIFSTIFVGPGSVKMSPGESCRDSQLFAELGGPPVELFLGPILSGGEVVAILYGDNFPEQRSIGDTDSLEIFLSQAGIAMGKALMESRLKEKRPEER
ncbi:response regulator [Geobacter argillaceus]|uniref:Response regulator receiver domain-containing protein n=1 Tax=Geobacter argillaceus TaxID=345631 RepID=A0A562W8Q5_9BACT|nr:response regulator [Geobacter argillaceus]TWJ26381.1 response regulator receiver domain-containing protein [Geobacter argillaceus]